MYDRSTPWDFKSVVLLSLCRRDRKKLSKMTSSESTLSVSSDGDSADTLDDMKQENFPFNCVLRFVYCTLNAKQYQVNFVLLFYV